jgi:hypothetical protein
MVAFPVEFVDVILYDMREYIPNGSFPKCHLEDSFVKISLPPMQQCRKPTRMIRSIAAFGGGNVLLHFSYNCCACMVSYVTF